MKLKYMYLDTLNANKDNIHKMAKVLLKKEELTGAELKRILGKSLENKLTNLSVLINI